MQAAYRPANEEWEPAVDLSEEGKRGMDAVVVLDAPGDATAADGDATTVWVSEEDQACFGEKGVCHSDTVQAAGYDPNGPLAVELEAPATGTVGEPVEISTPTKGLFAPLLEFGDGESVADTQASHIYEEPGEYQVTFGGAEVLGYRSSTQQTIKIMPVEPWHEPEAESPGPGTTDVNEMPATTPSADPPSAGSFPSTQCVAARAARDSALRRLRHVGARLSRARDTKKARHLAAAKHKQAAVLNRARRRAAHVC